MQGGSRSPGVSREGPGGSRQGPRRGAEVWAEKRPKKPEKRSGAVWLGCYPATSRILCRRF